MRRRRVKATLRNDDTSRLASFFSSLFSSPSPRGERRRVSRATPHDRPRPRFLAYFSPLPLAPIFRILHFPSEN